MSDPRDPKLAPAVRRGFTVKTADAEVNLETVGDPEPLERLAGAAAAASEKLSEVPFSVKLPDGDLADLDRVLEHERQRTPGHAITRSSLVRAAIRLYLNQHLARLPRARETETPEDVKS